MKLLEDITTNGKKIFATLEDGTITTIQGVRGDPGLNGLNGATGAAGTNGTNGAKGDTGLTGDTGPKGDKGDAFIYTDFTEQQLLDLTGPQGEQGIQGIQGIQGTQGIKGDTGTTGAKGDKGDIGNTGPQGADSTVAGPTGPTGAAGEDGVSGAIYSTAEPTSPVVLWIDPSVESSTFDISTQSEAETGTNNINYMTPLRTKQAITHETTATILKSTLGITTLSGSNTGDQTLPVKAIGSELVTGTNDTKFVTAKALVDAGNILKSSASPTSVKDIWVGTQAQYDAIGTKVATTLYCISA